MDETRPLPDDDGSEETQNVAGATLGRYVLVRRIGAGGCGEVFAAYDPVLDRRLALKVLFGEGSMAWAREARMLAKVDHPHVVTVFDAGVHEGKGFLATALVDGPDLQAWLEEQDERPAASALLDLLVPIAEALAAAHASGIVHGDVKPANILVASDGARITDFGVARAIDRDKDDEGRWAGTPAYMAPEQLEGDPSDERTDQYAFCLTLWETLFGAPTFPGDTTAVASGAPQSDTAVTPPRATGPASIVALADARRTPPQAAPSTPGLDLAVGEALLRGLQPDPRERFPSMGALIEALTILPKRKRQRRRTVAGALGVTGLVTAGALLQPTSDATCTGASEAMESVWSPSARAQVVASLESVDVPIAAEQAQTIAKALDAYAASWVSGHTEICEATAVRKEQSEALLDVRMSCMRRAKKEFAAAIDVLHDADATVLKNAERLLAGARPTSSCIEAEPDADGVEAVPQELKEQVDAVRDRLVEAESLQRAGRHREAKAIAEDATLVARELGYAPLIARASLRRGYAYLETAEPVAAGQALEEALELGLEHGPTLVGIEAASVLAYWASTGKAGASAGEAYANAGLSLIRKHAPGSSLHAGVLTNLGVVRSRQSRYEDARALFEQAHDMLEAELGPTHFRVLDMLDNLASVDMERRDMESARTVFEQSLALRQETYGENHFSTVLPLSNLGQVHSYVGQFEKASEYYHRAIELGVATLGDRDVGVAGDLVGLANVESKLGDIDGAGKHVDQALEVYRAAYGNEHPRVADALIVRGQLHFLQGDYAAAEPVYAEALRISKATLEPTHPQIAVCTERVALANTGLQRWAKAEEMFTEAIAAFDAAGLLPSTKATSLGQRGSVRMELGRLEDAATDLAAAAQLQREREGPAYPDDILTYNALGDVLRKLDRNEEAREAYGWSTAMSELPGLFPPDLANARAGLAMLDYASSPDKARAELTAQLEVLDAAGPDYASTAEELRAFLANPK